MTPPARPGPTTAWEPEPNLGALRPAVARRRIHDVTPYLASRAPGPTARRAILLWNQDSTSGSAPAMELLRSQGFVVDQSPSGRPLAEALQATEPDLVVLDLSDETLHACREIAASGRRVIVFSARGEALDQVAALEAGADDYILKGAHPLELLARVRAVLRRGDGGSERRPLCFDSRDRQVWRLDRRHGIVTGPGETSVRLNRSATELLWMLCQRPQELILRRDLATALFAPGPPPNSRALDVRVFRLRKALDICSAGGALIRTLHGIGYVLDAVVTTSGETVSLLDVRPAS